MSKSVQRRFEVQRGTKATEKTLITCNAEELQWVEDSLNEKDCRIEELEAELLSAQCELGKARSVIKQGLSELSEWEEPQSEYHTKAYKALLKWVEEDKEKRRTLGRSQSVVAKNATGETCSECGLDPGLICSCAGKKPESQRGPCIKNQYKLSEKIKPLESLSDGDDEAALGFWINGRDWGDEPEATAFKVQAAEAWRAALSYSRGEE